MTRVARILALTLLALAPAGCFPAAVGAVGGAALGGIAQRADTTAGAGMVGSAVAVTFAPARDVPVTGVAPAETTWVRGAVSLLGRVAGTHGDTLLVAVSEGRGIAGTATFPDGSGAAARVAPGSGVAVRVLSRAPSRAENAFVGGMLGAVVATVAIVLTIVLYCHGNTCND